MLALAEVNWEPNTEDNGQNQKKFFKSILSFSVRADGVYFMFIPCSSFWTLGFCGSSLGVFNH